MRRPPKDSTINRSNDDTRMVQVSIGARRTSSSCTSYPKSKAQKAANSANPFTTSDYTKIYRRFRKWADEPKSNLNQKPEWRQVVYLFFLLSANIGWRPDSEGLELTWDCVKVRHRKVRISNGEHKEESLAT